MTTQPPSRKSHGHTGRPPRPESGKKTGPHRFPRPERKHQHADHGPLLEGVIRVTGKGVGYVIIEGRKDDIEIDGVNLNCALDKDRVSVSLFGRMANRRQTGEVRAVLFRNKTAFVGILHQSEGLYILEPDDTRMYRDIIIPHTHLAGAKPGQKCLVEITSWTDPKRDPVGTVKRVLGTPGEHAVEMESIVAERGFDSSFDSDVTEAAEHVPLVIPEATISERLHSPIGRDFRDTLTFTIDPKDAKDFDDALSWKDLGNGTYEVGVHIADVSHYVTPHSRIDQEAVERATSIYLVDRTIPMLPERLSNGICSLVPNEDRLTFSAVFIMRPDGSIASEWFGKTIIHSKRRFTYEEATAILDTQRGDHAEALLSLQTIAQALRTDRIKNGAIAFEAEEVKFELDEHGKPLRTYKKVIGESNKLIEEFMLLANKRVAAYVANKDPRTPSVFLYRVHDAPNEDRMRDLREFLHGIGYPLKLSEDGQVSSKDINAMLSAVKGKAEEAMIQIATVRSMAKAVYTTKNIGHYGLGFEFYTHFTSPIRRYPDLMVHRLLERYLLGLPVKKERLAEEERLARYCSQMEVEAADAERASIRYKQCEYFADRIGYQFTGRISGVTEWGIYIEDPETKTEGMVHIRELSNDFFLFEEKHYRLVGKESGKVFRLGDMVQVVVRSVDLKQKRIDLRLAPNNTSTP
jgi:ribonuclease R